MRVVLFFCVGSMTLSVYPCLFLNLAMFAATSCSAQHAHAWSCFWASDDLLQVIVAHAVFSVRVSVLLGAFSESGKQQWSCHAQITFWFLRLLQKRKNMLHASSYNIQLSSSCKRDTLLFLVDLTHMPIVLVFTQDMLFNGCCHVYWLQILHLLSNWACFLIENNFL